MKRKMKITIASMAVLLVMALATTIISFSLANNNGEDDLVTEDELIALAADGDKTTNIDYIIKNSNSTDPDIDTMYHIVEIGSSDTPSTLQAFATTAAGKTGFEEYVLNGNKSASLAELMAEGKIDYQYYSVSSITDSDTAKLQKISQADFIYVSNDSAKPYAVGNDLCEQLYNLLHTYAVGDYKPFVIDSPTKTSNTPSQETSTLFKDLVTNYYAASGTRYYTYGWDPTATPASDFFSTTLGTSRYIGINSLNASGNWVVLDKADGTQANMANILTISVSGSIGDLTNAALTGCAEASGEGLTLNGNPVTAADNVYNLKPNGTESAFLSGGYSSRYSYRPDYVKVTNVSLVQDANGVYELPADMPDLSTFDLIIFEKDCADSDRKITIDSFKKLTAAMYADYHIIYDTRMGTSTDTDDEDVDAEETNYAELFYMVANEDEIERYPNIMVTDKEEFDIITSSNSAATCKVIADLINASSWRGIGGPGQSSNTFTVLEIQPCYPINEDIANAKNTYYSKPSEMVNNMTAEELGVDGTDLANATEFYDWEVSPAKIAEALNMDVSNITVKHVSTEELKSSKQTFLGNYDLIYIGGNTSAFKDVMYQRSITQIGRNASPNATLPVTIEQLRYLPTYRMYSHNGDLINLDFELLASAGWKATQGDKKNIVGNAVVNGTSVETFTMANGNDISYNNLIALQDYVKAGMPVIVSKDVATVYDMIQTDVANGGNAYLQNSIDPDSNMYKLLATCKAKSSTSTYWSLDNNGEDALVKVDNDGGRLGNTQVGYVTVYNEATSKELNECYARSTKRLTLALTKRPAEYNSYDETTKLSSSTLDYSFEVTGSSTCTIEFYIDEDGNGTFSSDERRTGQTYSGSSNSISGSFSFDLADYDGPVYWMIKASSGSMAANSTGVAFIKPDEGERSQVFVLQIVPRNNGDNRYDGAQGINSLYFCTECQKTLNVLDYNPVSQGHYDADSTIYASSDGGSAWVQPANGVYEYKTYEYWPEYKEITNSIVFGQHEHTFGIPRYVDTYAEKNSNGDDVANGIVGRDDWSDNLADELSDYYTFNLEIMTTAEYDAYSASIEKAYNNLKSLSATDEELRDASGTALADAETEYLAYIAGLDSIEDAISNSASGDELAATYDVISDTDGELAVKEKTLRNVIRDMIKAAGNDTINNAVGIGSSNILFKDEMIKRLQERDYYNFYGLAGFTNNTGTYLNSNGVTVKYCTQEQKDNGGFNYYFNDYSTAVNKKLELKKAYMDASCLNSYIVNYDSETGTSDWLTGSYDSVIVGPAENFNNDDIAAGVGTETLRSFASNGGTVLLFHETLGRYTDAGPANLTDALLDAAGSSSSFEADTSLATGVPYLPYKVKESVADTDSNAEEKYFLTNLSYKLGSEASTYTNWVEDMKAGYSSFSTPSYYYAPNLYSNNQFYESGRSSGTGLGSNPYKYGDYNWSYAAAWATSAGSGSSSKAGTDKATQNNKGIITTYPFTLSDRLNITGTHSSAFSVDVERDNLTVWYSLAGGTRTGTTPRGNSEIFAASPNDGEDSYFIYSNNNVFYCGAGHTKVTGQLKNNNDERRLYINIICNSVRKSTLQPSIKVYDYNSNPLTNKEIVETEDGYLYEISEETIYPYFSFKAITDEGDTLQDVMIYYKLDPDTPYQNFTTDLDKLIAHWTTENGGKIPFEAGDVVNIGPDFDATLKLEDKYFEPYGGNYTYIVIAVTTKNTETGSTRTVYQRIKIVRKPHLFDLT